MADGKWTMVNGSISLDSSSADSATFRGPIAKSRMISHGVIFELACHMPSPIIAERSFEFARRTVKLCEALWKRGRAAHKIADQLFDSGTSIGANTSESQGGQTKPDFLAKLAIARKESWETIFWLRLALASEVVKHDEIAWELDEAKQLKAMITQAIKTGQSSNWRGGP